jgi:DNA-binding PadR family transcriptional regulator
MAIQHAVLSLLDAGPCHGYELKTAFEAAVGPQWGQLNIGHLYQVLERLSRDGLVTSSRVPQETRPDRVVYRLTDAGSTELHRWLGEPSHRSGGYRDDFFLKLTAAARAGADTVATVIATQRAFLLRELRNLEQARRDADPMVGLLLSAAARHVAADLAFLDDAEQTLLTGDTLPTDQAGASSVPASRRDRRAADRRTA